MPLLMGTALSQNTALFHTKMDEHDARDVAKGEHAVGAPCAVFHGVDVKFNVGDMFVGGGWRIEIRMPRPEEFEFMIGKQGINYNPPGLVESKNCLQDRVDSGNTTVWQSLHSSELEGPGLGHKKGTILTIMMSNVRVM